MTEAIQAISVVIVFAVGTLGMVCLFLLLLGWIVERLVVLLKIKRGIIDYHFHREKFLAWLNGGENEL